MRALIQEAMGLEANIAHQKSDQFFRDLTAVCEQLKKETGDVVGQNHIVRKVNEVVKKHTGLHTVWEVEDKPWPNAAVYCPTLTLNHPLNRHFTAYLTQYPLRAVRKYLGDELKKTPFYASSKTGSIDLVNSRVSGVFTEVEFKCYINRGFIDLNFEPAEIAAVILHEVGHAFTYLLWLSKTAATNIMIESAWRDLQRETNQEVKVTIIDNLSGILNVEVDRESLKNTNSKEYFTTVLLNANPNAYVSDVVGNEYYSLRNVEQLADQFASRHGATRASASCHYKFQKLYNRTSFRTRNEHFAVEGFKAALFLMSIPLSVGLSFLFLVDHVLQNNRDISTYDQARQRMLKLQNEVVARLKEPNMNKQLREQFTEEYRFIQTLLDQMSDQRTIVEWLIAHSTGWLRGQQKLMTFQMELERLLNNELFYQSQRLRSLK